MVLLSQTSFYKLRAAIFCLTELSEILFLLKLWCCDTKSGGYCGFGDVAQLMRGSCQVRTTSNIPPPRTQEQHQEAGRLFLHHIQGVKYKHNLAPTIAMLK